MYINTIKSETCYNKIIDPHFSTSSPSSQSSATIFLIIKMDLINNDKSGDIPSNYIAYYIYIYELLGEGQGYM